MERKTTGYMHSRHSEFLKLCCSDMKYQQIAEKLSTSTRTVENYAYALYKKLNVKTRVGFVLYAIEHGIVEVRVKSSQFETLMDNADSDKK